MNALALIRGRVAWGIALSFLVFFSFQWQSANFSGMHFPPPCVFFRSHCIMTTYSLSRKCARMFVQAMCRQNGKSWPVHVNAVVIHTYGSYGNHLIQLIPVLAFCLLTNVKYIYFRPDFLWLGKRNITTPQSIHMVSLATNNFVSFSDECIIVRGFWRPTSWCGDFSYSGLVAQVREGLLAALPAVTVDPDTLYLYFRGGREQWDQKHGVHPNYGQPPCSFYLDAMRNFTKVRALGGDLHPCRPVVIRAGATWKPFDDRRDMARMVYSRHIVLARSSRSHAVLALSPWPKQFWVFDLPAEWGIEPVWWRGFSPLMFGHGLHCVPSDAYRTAIQPWRATPQQVQLVLNGICNWGPVPCTPGVESPTCDQKFCDEPV
jgi:hypothetical protein